MLYLHLCSLSAALSLNLRGKAGYISYISVLVLSKTSVRIKMFRRQTRLQMFPVLTQSFYEDIDVSDSSNKL